MSDPIRSRTALRRLGGAALGAALALGTAACGSDAATTADAGGQDAPVTPDACVGLGCLIATCEGGVPTTLTGRVFAPNGSLPLYNVTVYVPTTEVEALATGATCDRCGEPSGNPIARTTTDANGEFRLENVPATTDLPVVIQIGKWRRQIVVPSVPACAETAIPEEATRLPKNQSEGDIPQMALSTGGGDALECLLRKIGLDDSEFTTAAGSGRVHLYAGLDGTPQFASSFNGGGSFPSSDTLWDSLAHLSAYDVTFLSCEGSPWQWDTDQIKPPAARQAIVDYAALGGRVFMSHLHDSFIVHAPPSSQWQTVPTPSDPFTAEPYGDQDPTDERYYVTVDIDQSTPKGVALAAWLGNTGALDQNGQLKVSAEAVTTTAVDTALAERLVHRTGDAPSVQYYQFTTPLTAPSEERCGRVAFADLHVSHLDESEAMDPLIEFPNGCVTEELSPQEKVLAFMVFDIASCISPAITRTVPR